MKYTNIVMLMRNRLTLTLQSLNSLYRNTPSDEFNLTLVDDDSSQGVRAALAHWISLPSHANCTLLQITRGRSITGQARNLGVYWSERLCGRGDYLYLSDNDVYFTPGWLSKLVDTMDDPRAFPVLKLLGGSTHPFHGANATYKWADKARELREHDAVSGYSHLMRWETWDKYGPLDAHAPGTGQSEDFKFCQQIIADGGRVATVWPEVVYACGITNTAGQPAVGADQMRRYPGVIQE